jgi:hypothetical protein
MLIRADSAVKPQNFLQPAPLLVRSRRLALLHTNNGAEASTKIKNFSHVPFFQPHLLLVYKSSLTNNQKSTT